MKGKRAAGGFYGLGYNLLINEQGELMSVRTPYPYLLWTIIRRLGLLKYIKSNTPLAPPDGKSG